MCTSRLHRVVSDPAEGRMAVEDLDGARHDVSLLAFDGPPPTPGDWVVVHSGYALEAVDPDEAKAAAAEIRAAWGVADRTLGGAP